MTKANVKNIIGYIIIILLDIIGCLPGALFLLIFRFKCRFFKKMIAKDDYDCVKFRDVIADIMDWRLKIMTKPLGIKEELGD